MTLVVTLAAQPLVSDQAPPAAGQASLRDHSIAFGRLDILARQMRDAGAPLEAVRWCARQADIAYRAARSEAGVTIEGRTP